MEASGGQSVGEALAEFRRMNGIPQDEADRAFWNCRLGPISVRLPNFNWRKSAILAHDLHHLVASYPCTVRGECQMAAWEFGAGRMPHWGARLFCLPLVLAGLLWSPRRMWRAFSSGRQSQSLHGTKLDHNILAARFDGVRAAIARQRPPISLLSAYVLFAMLIVEAILIVSAPAAVIAGLWFVWGGYPGS